MNNDEGLLSEKELNEIETTTTEETVSEAAGAQGAAAGAAAGAAVGAAGAV